jgi:hypothetical protein
MKILISDDCDIKFKDIKELILQIYPKAEITRVTYAKAGLKELLKNGYDYLIQDMFLPINFEEEIDTQGGIYILNQVKFRGIKVKSCICSSDKISQSYMIEAGFSKIPFINYSSSYFREDLTNFIEGEIC